MWRRRHLFVHDLVSAPEHLVTFNVAVTLYTRDACTSHFGQLAAYPDDNWQSWGSSWSSPSAAPGPRPWCVSSLAIPSGPPTVSPSAGCTRTCPDHAPNAPSLQFVQYVWSDGCWGPTSRRSETLFGVGVRELECARFKPFVVTRFDRYWHEDTRRESGQPPNPKWRI